MELFFCVQIFKTKKEYILKEIPMETVNEDERALALNEVQILKVGQLIGENCIDFIVKTVPI